ncbi:MAG: hypothetical protein QXJ27_05275, partial [Thermoplasmata archaeon]
SHSLIPNNILLASSIIAQTHCPLALWYQSMCNALRDSKLIGNSFGGKSVFYHIRNNVLYILLAEFHAFNLFSN